MSIRARVAFGLVCVDRAVDELGLRGKWIDQRLRGLWWYTAAANLSAWGCKVGVEELEQVYGSTVNHDSLELLSQMFAELDEIGGGNLFGGFRDEYTRVPTLNLVRLLTSRGIPIPPPKPFIRISPRKWSDAWGAPFSAAQLEALLHESE
jgi:hypothetical protein